MLGTDDAERSGAESLPTLDYIVSEIMNGAEGEARSRVSYLSYNL